MDRVTKIFILLYRYKVNVKFVVRQMQSKTWAKTCFPGSVMQVAVFSKALNLGLCILLELPGWLLWMLKPLNPLFHLFNVDITSKTQGSLTVTLQYFPLLDWDANKTSKSLEFSPSLCQCKAVLCPMSGKPIKMNELITVHFTPLDSSLDRVALLTRQVSLFQDFVVLHTAKWVLFRVEILSWITTTYYYLTCLVK